MTRLLIVLAAIAAVVAYRARAAGTERTYLPLLLRDTALVGQSIVFDGRTFGPDPPVPMRLVVTAAERRAELPGTTGCGRGYPVPGGVGAVAAQGVFVVVLGQVTDEGLVSGYFDLSGFRMADSLGRRFDPAGFDAQCTAQALYGRVDHGLLQPGFTAPVVVVFDVLPASTGLHLVLASSSPFATATPTAVLAPTTTATPSPTATATLTPTVTPTP